MLADRAAAALAARTHAARARRGRSASARANLDSWAPPPAKRARSPLPSRPPTNALATLLEALDASALLGAAAGAAAVMVTEQLAFATLPLALPIVALLAGRAAKALRAEAASQASCGGCTAG